MYVFCKKKQEKSGTTKKNKKSKTAKKISGKNEKIDFYPFLMLWEVFEQNEIILKHCAPSTYLDYFNSISGSAQKFPLCKLA